jgi:hypothetical protein
MAQEYARAVVAAAAFRRSAAGHLVDQLKFLRQWPHPN